MFIVVVSFIGDGQIEFELGNSGLVVVLLLSEVGLLEMSRSNGNSWNGYVVT